MIPKIYTNSQSNYDWSLQLNELTKGSTQFSQSANYRRALSSNDKGSLNNGKKLSLSAYPFSVHSKARDGLSPSITSSHQKKKKEKIARHLLKDRKIETSVVTGQTTTATLKNQIENNHQDGEVNTPSDFQNMDLKHIEDAKLKLESICGAQFSQEQLEFLIMEYIISRCSLNLVSAMDSTERMNMNRCSSASTSTYEDVYFLH